MTRDEVIQSLIDRFDGPSYLEIGVDHGVTFHAVKAAHKVAVDPYFKFDVASAEALNPNCTYIAHESDEFFRVNAGKKFDVIYLDGLHTFGQVLRDLLNSTEVLAERGAIVIDDVLPSTYSASLPDLEDTFRVREFVPSERLDGSWMGDVYKLVFFIATYMPRFSYATVAENHGQLVMWRSPRLIDSSRASNILDIVTLDYAGMIKRVEIFKRMPFAEIMSQFDRR